jgi:uncharacterized membrane protein
MSIAISLHILFAALWVGGMFFAYVCLRPVAASLLEAPARLTLWLQTFQRFFIWVWAAIIILPSTGVVMIHLLGGMQAVGKHVHIMILLGTLMIALFMHIYFALFFKLQKAVATQDWPTGGILLNKIRRLVGINLILGLVTILVATSGRWM